MGSNRLAVAVGVALTVLVTALISSSAFASVAAPGWTIESFPTPTVFTASVNGRCEEEGNASRAFEPAIPTT